MICKNCGFTLEKNDKFCPKCGYKIKKQIRTQTEEKKLIYNKESNHKIIIGVMTFIAIFTLICGFALLSRDGLGISIDGKYYGYEERYYLKSDLDLTPEEINDGNDWIKRKTLTGAYIILDGGNISSSEYGDGYFYMDNNNLRCDIDGLSYSMTASYGRIINILDANNELVAAGLGSGYIKDDTDEYKELFAQKQNKKLPKYSEILFEIMDEKGEKILTADDIMSVNESKGYPSDLENGAEGIHRALQIDFLYECTDRLKQYAGQNLQVMYYGNSLYSFVLKLEDIEPFFSLSISYDNVTSIPALDDLIDKLFGVDGASVNAPEDNYELVEIINRFETYYNDETIVKTTDSYEMDDIGDWVQSYDTAKNVQGDIIYYDYLIESRKGKMKKDSFKRWFYSTNDISEPSDILTSASGHNYEIYCLGEWEFYDSNLRKSRKRTEYYLLPLDLIKDNLLIYYWYWDYE